MYGILTLYRCFLVIRRGISCNHRQTIKFHWTKFIMFQCFTKIYKMEIARFEKSLHYYNRTTDFDF